VDIETIKRELEFNTGKFPREALQAGVEQREAITPVLLAALQEAADDPAEIDRRQTNYILHIYAMYLLAQFREHAAYPLLVKFFSTPGEITLDLTGDVVTEDLCRILASVCHNDLHPIKGMIEDDTVNEYVRSAGLHALAVLVAEEALPREDIIAYLRSLLQSKLKRELDFVWSALVSVACDIYPEELLPDIQQAYADDLVDLWVIRMEHVQETVAEGKEETLQKLQRGRYRFIRDAIADMAWWACFEKDSKPPQPKYSTPNKQQTSVKSNKIGRNDPCPCGSGKKYKKCCYLKQG